MNLEAPKTVPQVFGETVKKYSNDVALRYTVLKPHAAHSEKFSEQFEQISYTWAQYDQYSSQFAKSLMKLKVTKGVSIQGANSPQWFFANIGAMKAGNIAAGIYPTNGKDATQHCVQNCEAEVVVVENEAQLKKYEGLEATANRCYVVWSKVYNLHPLDKLGKVYTWEEFLNVGKDVTDDELKKRSDLIAPTKSCAIIYTSGTTGLPKGAELTHDNLTWTGFVAGHKFQLNHNHHGLSYLPLSHIAAQQVDCITAMTFGYKMDIAPPGALKGAEMKKHIMNARPTFFLAVPDVWKKMKDGMVEKMAQAKGTSAEVKKFLFNRITPIARSCLIDIQKLEARNYSNGIIDRIRGFMDRFALELCNLLFLNRVKALIGLDRCMLAASGAAPIPADVVDFFAGLGIRIVDLYGMSETSGLITLSADRDVPSGSVGKPLPGTEVILGTPDAEGVREILIHWKSRNIFLKYHNNVEETEKVFDKDGYFHTGDAGAFDEHGNLRITGRIKELLKTSGGENIPPLLIEDKIKNALPPVSQAVVIGNNQKFLTSLITLKTKVDEENNPTDELTEEVREVIGTQAKTLQEAAIDSKVLHYLEEGIAKANSKAISNAQYVQKFKVLPHELTVANGLITPTLKLKRKAIEATYHNEIHDMYATQL